jgi:hypothetical protein
MTEDELKRVDMLRLKVLRAKETCSMIAEFARKNDVKVKPASDSFVLTIGEADFLLGLMERQTS